MAKRLSDSEFAERARAANRRRTARYQQRLVSAGKSALTVWIPDTVRKALTEKAANDGATIADTAAELLSAALCPSIPPFDAPVDRDSQIRALKRQGLSNYAIADQVGCSEPTVRRALKKQEAV